MAWWDIVLQQIKQNDSLQTPGRGVNKTRSQPFKIISKHSSEIVIGSGKSTISIERLCFDTIEKAFAEYPGRWLRVASLHDQALEDSADKLIRESTGSQLARGNYVCSMLEHCGLVRYTLRGERKGIELSQIEAPKL